MTQDVGPEPRPFHVMILAGEPSGDLHGANLVRSMKRLDPSLSINGIGGDLMAAQGMELFFHIRSLSVMGVTEVIRQFKVINRAFNRFRQRVRTTKPDLVILIDYPGFNLRAAAFAKKNGVPVLYYITPKVWAWKKSRLRTMRRVVDHAALIFPFELPLFKQAGIASTFVGHPLLDCYPETTARQIPLDDAPFVVGLLPGSRENEISALLAPMVQAALLIRKQDKKVRFLVSLAATVDPGRILETIDTCNKKFPGQQPLFGAVKGPCQTLFDQCDLLIAASGTVTLEAAICGVPMIIVYHLSRVSYFIARIFVRIKHVGLANIIANEQIVPELLQDDATAENIARTALTLLNRQTLGHMRTRLLMVRKRLGGQGAAYRTARLALELLRSRNLSGNKS
ncbi:LpxB [Desulforapulum autotrophicum HRM2]|uniref:Lipid-A-disaccharide synthase n=1 Tax=Desulforapulum autotrophicum (strain ATCC 43914 / DSM 3382 / VKM B-1955 / HRM2) TaxID=177437 RepID=C0QEK2_DESAH|nr:lipid-A-disaccharide synthase [Desulforapulum autotrophicum]ACN15344.1 LpxB [Desulforapulum autotrophicum HRM2]